MKKIPRVELKKTHKKISCSKVAKYLFKTKNKNKSISTIHIEQI